MVPEMKKRGYAPRDFIAASPLLADVFRMIESNFFSPDQPGIFDPLVRNLKQADPYFICADFDAYCRIQAAISENYLDQADWTRKAISNVAKSGQFSSDRTIAEYCRDIWGVGPGARRG